jgi:GT2 family glycosyltransferase
MTIQPQVTILVPHYKTLELTKLCLRLIRKHTDLRKVQVIVIDNGSQDRSLDYLRSLSWIKLIEREPIAEEGAISSHSRALDLGLAQVTTPYVLSIHTDTLVKHAQWLAFLVAQIEKSPSIAGVGSWKLEFKPWWRRGLKKIERMMQLAYCRLLAKPPQSIEGVGKNYYYLRSHCALYRMDLIKKYDLHFFGGDNIAGKAMHKRLAEAGYQLMFLPSETLAYYLEHINHATSVLNPELSTRAKSVDKGLRRIQRSLDRLHAHAILADDGLDQ